MHVVSDQFTRFAVTVEWYAIVLCAVVVLAWLGMAFVSALWSRV